jgi:hypothetical protein
MAVNTVLWVIVYGPQDALAALDEGLGLWIPPGLPDADRPGGWIDRSEKPRDGHIEFGIRMRNHPAIGCLLDLSRRYPLLHIDGDETSTLTDDTWKSWACLKGG